LGRVIITPEKIRESGFEPVALVGKNNKNQFVWRVVCHCGNEFDCVASSLVSGNTKSCGCMQYKRKNLTGMRIGRLLVLSESTPKVMGTGKPSYRWLCQCDCGKTTIGSTHSLLTHASGKRGGKSSCGCANRESIARSQKFGPEHHCWKPELSPKERQEGRRSNWLWSKSVFAKDNFTCLKCGQRGGELHAHHIYPYARFPDLRLDIENGATLCKPCHFLFHKIYGKQKSTAENYQQWIAQ
jgi:5-methylcytosine-specific restriction endonuclease McrA